MQKRLKLESVPESSGPLGQLFHPAVANWFTARFGAPTPVQQRAWEVTTQHRDALIAAPTGSGKTLAAFMGAINDLVIEGLEQGLSDEVHVLYVSPLKALSNDIQKNLQEPLAGIRAQLTQMGLPDVPIRDAVRTGDTSTLDRDRMRKSPPHILVTTPESLFILLTSESGRTMLQSVRSVIVDELHAVAGNKRGAHLMLSLERLSALTGREPIRIGLSATQKPIEDMAHFLMGRRKLICHPEHREGSHQDEIPRDARNDRDLPCAIIDTGYTRQRDIALEVPRSPLDAVMSNEVWTEIYDRIAQLTRAHRTTLIFVNQRRLAERAARHLAERIGEEHVTAHHGSLAKEHRLKAEQRLKTGQLKALVATSALELGIDIGDIDLVVQLGSPRSIAAFLQRVGRAGHSVGAVPKGRLFPLSQDDLLEGAALVDSVRRGELDRIRVPLRPLDVLAQQIVAETGSREWTVDDLYARFTMAAPFRDLTKEDYEKVLQMLADGYATRRGRRGAYLHYDQVNRVLRGRRGARLTALTNAGVIPDQFDYDVVMLPEEHKIGTLNEDFSFESIPGDIFQLGNTSYRILKIEVGKVYVEDARGQPPNLPFWLGEGLGRSNELSQSVSRLIEHAEQIIQNQDLSVCQRWLEQEIGLPSAGAEQLTQYLATAHAALGVLPNDRRIVLERFFDDVGDAHLVIHSPHGSRINRAWGLALRKRFCRSFNFELQASALEDSIVLSLGPTHSFPLDDIKNYLKSASVREVLVQALLDAPMFNTRWRWVASTALALKRNVNGKRLPPQFQRSDSEDLLTVVFPDQVACAENLTGERQIPDHPLVTQTIHDCLHEVMDITGLEQLLARIERGEVEMVCRDLAGPSPLAHAILHAKPYAFLDDGEAEERRTRAVSSQRLHDLQSAADLGRLDAAAIERVREEAWPEFGSADELHDALMVFGFLTVEEVAKGSPHPGPLPRGEGDNLASPIGRGRREAPGEGSSINLAAKLVDASRATRINDSFWVATERLHEFLAIDPKAQLSAKLKPMQQIPDAHDALREVLRSRLELLGPVTTAQLAAPLAVSDEQAYAALLQLEAGGGVMRGNFTGTKEVEWCERRLLARIHRYTRERQRSTVTAVSPAQFMRFLLRWHQVEGASATDERRQGESGLYAALRQLEGYAVPAGAWERDLLAARMKFFTPDMLDKLCASGRIAWQRPAESGEAKKKSGPVRNTPILLAPRENLAYWQQQNADAAQGELPLSGRAQRVLEALRTHGASFLSDLAHDSGLVRTEAEEALGELVSQGLVTSDSFAGLRALTMTSARKQRIRQRSRGLPVEEAGRWALVRSARAAAPVEHGLAAPHVEHIARVLLRRYGVVFRKLLEREDRLPTWRELFYVYRRMEARGEIRGGRFVSGFSGEQFALPDAAAALKGLPPAGADEWVALSAADPLNLVGVLLPGERVAALAANRVLFKSGVPAAVQSGDEVRYLQEADARAQWELKNHLIRRQKSGSYVEQPQAMQ